MTEHSINLNKLTKQELFNLCEKNNLSKYKSKNKNELIELLNLSNNEKKQVTSQNSNIINKEIKIEIENMDGLKYLKTIEDNSIDLILTDPPYIISKESGMNTHFNNIKYNEENNILQVKTEEEWNKYKEENNIENDINKENYLKYG